MYSVGWLKQKQQNHQKGVNVMKIWFYFLSCMFWLATGGMWQDYNVNKNTPLFVPIIVTILGLMFSAFCCWVITKKENKND